MSEAKKSKAKKSWAITCKVQNVMGPIMLSQSVARSIMSGTKRLWPKCNPGQSEYIEDAKGNIFMEQKMWFGLVLARFGYKMTFLHLLNKSRGFHTWFFQITTPNIICAGTFLLSRETFFCRNLKNARMSFWANVMLRQPHVMAFRAFSGQKWPGLRVVCFKNFSWATFCIFWSTQMVDTYLSYLPVKRIWWKSIVCPCETSI